MQLMESVKRESGLYTIQEAAKYARIPVATLRYWIVGDKTHPPLRESQIDREEGKFLTFLEFQEAVAIRSFRVNYGASLPRIREAIYKARDKYGVEHPFASKFHKTYLVGRDFHIVLKDDINPIQLTGKGEGQKSFVQCIEEYMRDFQFDEKDMLFAYTAYRYPTETGKQVQINMNPAYCFGAPIVGNTGYRAQTLWRAALAEGSIQKTAEYYGIDCDSVVAACRYCEEIEKAA